MNALLSSSEIPVEVPRRETFQDKILEIQAALQDVNPMTIQEWEDAFRREPYPNKEAAYWLHAGRLYQRCVAQRQRMSLDQRKKCLHLILASFNSPPKMASQVALGIHEICCQPPDSH